jgi:hypothetical protein
MMDIAWRRPYPLAALLVALFLPALWFAASSHWLVFVSLGTSLCAVFLTLGVAMPDLEAPDEGRERDLSDR